MKHGTLYIGHTTKDNEKLDDGLVWQTIGAMLDDYGVQGATFSKAVGVWRGRSERATLVRISGIESETLKGLCYRLCRLLNQESIGWVPSEPMEFLS